MPPDERTTPMNALRSAGLALTVALLCVSPTRAQSPTEPPDETTATTATAAPTQDEPAAAPGVARAVLFTSENCPHCADVIYRVLPDIQTLFGSQLEVLQFKTQDPYGDILYQMAYELFMPPDSGREVPVMVIGDRLLVGVGAIRDEFPVLVQTHLSQGGVDWPAIPGLRESIAQAQSPAAAPAEPTEIDTEEPPATVEPTQEPATPTPAATPVPTPEPSQGLLAGSAGKALLLVALLAFLGILLAAVRFIAGRRSA